MVFRAILWTNQLSMLNILECVFFLFRGVCLDQAHKRAQQGMGYGLPDTLVTYHACWLKYADLNPCDTI